VHQAPGLKSRLRVRLLREKRFGGGTVALAEEHFGAEQQEPGGAGRAIEGFEGGGPPALLKLEFGLLIELFRVGGTAAGEQDQQENRGAHYGQPTPLPPVPPASRRPSSGQPSSMRIMLRRRE
jgi:hypothetical protein